MHAIALDVPQMGNIKDWIQAFSWIIIRYYRGLNSAINVALCGFGIAIAVDMYLGGCFINLTKVLRRRNRVTKICLIEVGVFRDCSREETRRATALWTPGTDYPTCFLRYPLG